MGFRTVRLVLLAGALVLVGLGQVALAGASGGNDPDVPPHVHAPDVDLTGVRSMSGKGILRDILDPATGVWHSFFLHCTGVADMAVPGPNYLYASWTNALGQRYTFQLVKVTRSTCLPTLDDFDTINGLGYGVLTGPDPFTGLPLLDTCNRSTGVGCAEVGFTFHDGGPGQPDTAELVVNDPLGRGAILIACGCPVEGEGYKTHSC